MLKRKLPSLFCALFWIVYSSSLSSAEERPVVQANHSAQASPFVLPIAKRDSLLNGLQLIVMEEPGSGRVAVQLRVNSGGVFDPAGKAGVAEITANLLFRGGGGFSAKNVSETIDQFGLTVTVTVGWDTSDIIINGPAEHIDAIFDLLSRVVVTPAFDQKELDALKAQRLDAVKAETAAESKVLLHKALEALYGSHPYGRPLAGTAGSLAQIARQDVSSFYSRFYLANNAELIVYGDTAAEQVTKQARAKLGTWKKGDVVSPDFRQPERLVANRAFLFDRTPAGNGLAVLAMYAVSRRAQDYFAAAMAVDILNQSLARAGIGATARLDARLLPGPLIIDVNSAPEKLAEQLKTIMDIMTGLQKDGLAAEQVEAARARLLSAMGERLHTNATIATVILDIETYGLGRDYVLHFGERVNAVTPLDVQAAAREYLKPQAMVVVMSGPASILGTDTRRFGAVTVIR